MRIVHNDMEGFLVDLEDQVDEGPVVRWMITRLPSEDTDGVDDVYLIASFLIDGMICEVAINTGIADKHVVFCIFKRSFGFNKPQKRNVMTL